MTIYFVRTRHHYHPYDDWYKLAELSGFETCYEDEIDYDDSSNTYIINHFAGRNLDANRPTKAQVILWQTEHITPERYEADYGIDCRKNWRFWHMDKWQATVLSQALGINCEYIPIGSHKDLGYVGIKGTYKYDVALLAYHSPRRQPIFHWIKGASNVAPDSAWGDERGEVLTRSRLMVHIHQQEDFPVIPGLRFALAAAHNLPVICESVNHEGIYQNVVMFKPIESLRDYLLFMLMHTNRENRMRYTDVLHELLCVRNTFKKVVEGAL